jgi:phenylalanine-4-hydroxylase
MADRCGAGLVPRPFSSTHRQSGSVNLFHPARDQLDYLQGRTFSTSAAMPLLMNPVFADYMQAYGEAA